MSRQISNLEHELRARLIERRSTGAVLTAEGQLLARYTQTMFRDLQRLRADIDEFQELRRGEVTLFTIEGIVGDLLPDIIRCFFDRFPNISFTVSAAGSDRTMEAIALDEADIGLAYNVKPRAEIEVIGSYRLPSRAMVAPGHPLAARKRLTAEQLFAHRLALPNGSFGLRRLVDQVAARHGLEVREALCTNSFELMKSVARTGHAVAILPDLVARREIGAGELLPIPVDDPDLLEASLQVFVHRQRALPAASREFLDHFLDRIRHNLEEMPSG